MLEITKGTIKRGQYRETVNKRQRLPKGQSREDNPEHMATQGTQDEEKQNKNTTQYVLDTTMRKYTNIHK